MQPIISQQMIQDSTRRPGWTCAGAGHLSPDQGTLVPLRDALVGHTVETVYERGWSKLSNGGLLAVTEAARMLPWVPAIWGAISLCPSLRPETNQ